MLFKDLKIKTAKELVELGSCLDQAEKMQLAINLKIALATVVRYMKGDVDEVRKLELAEKIIAEAKKLLDLKVI